MLILIVIYFRKDKIENNENTIITNHKEGIKERKERMAARHSTIGKCYILVYPVTFSFYSSSLFFCAVKKHKDISPPNVAKIPAYYVPNVLLSTISVTEGLSLPPQRVHEKKLSPYVCIEIYGAHEIQLYLINRSRELWQQIWWWR